MSECVSYPSVQPQEYLTGRLYPSGTSEPVCRGVFLALGGSGKAADSLEFPGFIQSSSHLLRGSLTQRCQRLLLLCSSRLELLRQALQALLTTLCDSPSNPWVPSSPESLASLVEFLTRPLGGVADGRSFSVDEVELWLSSSPAVGRILDVSFGATLYHRIVSSSEPPPAEVASLVGVPVMEGEGEGERLDTQRVLIPLLLTPHPTQHTLTSSLLSSAALLMINSYLPAEVRGQLYPLFLSGVHGNSFSTLCKSLVASGPCVLVIRDSGGHIFGGFAAVSWQFGPQFTGEPTSHSLSLYLSCR